MIRGRSLFSINLGESLWGETEEKFQILTEEVQQNWTVLIHRTIFQLAKFVPRLNSEEELQKLIRRIKTMQSQLPGPMYLLLLSQLSHLTRLCY